MIIFPTTGKNLAYSKGNVIQGFYDNPDLYKQFNLPSHGGIDIVPNIGYGQPVYSPTNGIVVRVYYDANPALGNQVHVLSDPFPDGWCLLSKLGHFAPGAIVKEGDRVTPGQHIANMGNTGFVVSGGVSYWHQANPDNKGTHTHWSTYWLKEVAAGQPSNTSYLGKNYIIKNYNNGYLGAFDPETLFKDYMTNAKLVKNGNEYGFYLPATSQEAMIDKALNLGVVLPTTDNGTKVDWANLHPDIVI